jgi:hypothetical protein
VIDELADDKNKIMEAEKLGVGPTNVDVDGAFAQMCSRMRTTPGLLSKSLDSPGIRPTPSSSASRRIWPGQVCAA